MGDLPRETVRVADVISAVTIDCLPRAGDRSIGIDVSCDERIEAEVDAPLLEQALINLVDNAIKYSDTGRTIWVTVTTEASGTDRAARGHDGP